MTHCLRFAATAFAAVLFAAVLAACGQPPGGPPPVAAGVPEVSAITLRPQRLPLTAELPGRVASNLSAEVRPQVGGIVQQRLFVEGSAVKAGQLLYLIDAASYRAAVDTAAASLARAEAAKGVAESKSNRQRELVALRAVSRQDADDAQAALEQAAADVAAAKAELQSRRIDLDRTRVTAPVAGRIGRSAVTPGALVTANQAAALATVQQLDPIYVDVTQPSATLLALQRSLADGSLGSGAAKVKLVLEDGTAYPEPGVLQFSELAVDADTGSVTLRVQVRNPRGVLLPGLYVRAVLEQGVVEDALLVPQQAVMRDAAGKASVAVIAGDGTLQHRAVTTLRAVGDQWLIGDGLAAGERVAVDGQHKAAPGATVRIVPGEPAVGQPPRLAQAPRA